MRNGCGKKQGGKKKIAVKIMATNVVASQPPNSDRLQRQPHVQKKKNNGENSGPLMSLLVNRPKATDCNTDRSCKKKN